MWMRAITIDKIAPVRHPQGGMHIELKGLGKRFARSWALSEVSCSVAPGTVTVLLGENGAGKSTLLYCLGGVLGPTTGTILYDGERFCRERADLRRRLAILPDTPPIDHYHSPVKHAAMVLKLYGQDVPSDEITGRVIDLMEGFDLLAVADNLCGSLSRGQAYKTALVALIAADPELWLLDEPMASGMDPRGLRLFKQEVRNAVERGRTVVYSTQILSVAREFSDRALVLHKGRLVADGPVSQWGDGGPADLDEVFARLTEDRRDTGGGTDSGLQL